MDLILHEMLDALAKELEGLVGEAWKIELMGRVVDDGEILNLTLMSDPTKIVHVWWEGAIVTIVYALDKNHGHNFDMNEPDSLDKVLTMIARVCSYKQHNEPERK